jgi:hypothetical protein
MAAGAGELAGARSERARVEHLADLAARASRRVRLPSFLVIPEEEGGASESDDPNVRRLPVA